MPKVYTVFSPYFGFQLMVTSRSGELGLHAAEAVKTELRRVLGAVPIPLHNLAEETAWDLLWRFETASRHAQVSRL